VADKTRRQHRVDTLKAMPVPRLSYLLAKVAGERRWRTIKAVFLKEKWHFARIAAEAGLKRQKKMCTDLKRFMLARCTILPRVL